MLDPKTSSVRSFRVVDYAEMGAVRQLAAVQHEQYDLSVHSFDFFYLSCVTLHLGMAQDIVSKNTNLHLLCQSCASLCLSSSLFVNLHTHFTRVTDAPTHSRWLKVATKQSRI